MSWSEVLKGWRAASWPPLILVVVGALLLAASATAGNGCNSRACIERVAMHQCSQTNTVPCARRAAMHHGVDLRMLLRKARCESGLNPYAYNGAPFNRTPTSYVYGGGTALHPNVARQKSTGWAQFMPSTWNSTPYAHRSIWQAKWSSLAMAWMHKVGRGREWVCT